MLNNSMTFSSFEFISCVNHLELTVQACSFFRVTRKYTHQFRYLLHNFHFVETCIGTDTKKSLCRISVSYVLSIHYLGLFMLQFFELNIALFLLSTNVTTS